MKHTYETGLLGEDIAAEWLEQHYGMRLLESRYKTKAGEIDLIMQDEETIVFVEVKTRTNAVSGSGLMAVDRNKQKRIANAAIFYLMKNGKLNSSVRFDAVEICSGRVLHIPNAFQPGNGFFYR